MRYLATHVTRYRYQVPVAQCLTEARLVPRSLPWQRVIETRVHVEPEAAFREDRQDYFGNTVTSLSVFRTHDQYSITGESVVDVEAREMDVPSIPWEDARHPESLEALEYLFDSPFVPRSTELAALARHSFPPGQFLFEGLKDFSARIHKEFQYKPNSTTINMPLLEILARRKGVCQDFAHIMIGGLRSLGLPARYVSGYLRSGQGAEASHAWVSAYIPEFGWLDLDPTNNVIPALGHVTLAWGRDFGDVTPVKGISLGGGGQTVEVEVRVLPLEEKESEASHDGDGAG